MVLEGVPAVKLTPSILATPNRSRIRSPASDAVTFGGFPEVIDALLPRRNSQHWLRGKQHVKLRIQLTGVKAPPETGIRCGKVGGLNDRLDGFLTKSSDGNPVI